MDKALLLDAVRGLAALGSGDRPFAREQAVRQFNVLLEQSKELHPNRPDIVALAPYDKVQNARCEDYDDSVQRLKQSLELRPPGSINQIADGISLPPDATAELAADLQEFKEAVALGLQRTALLLAGSIAEALLLLRHSDTSERGPAFAIY